jgi:hypothetical protein
MPQDPMMMPEETQEADGISQLIQLAAQAADAIDQLGQALSMLQQPQQPMGPPPGAPQMGAGGPPVPNNPQDMAMQQAMAARSGGMR